jgi:succinyl-CoA synthetase alpha subunit
MMFSDNVSIEDEVALKNLAHDKGLLMMGPDCGTAILGGVGLCFANTVRRGNIGIVGASGTGSQEVSVRIHDFGGGITQLIGTGGRDLSEKVGGIMMIDGLRALARDEETRVIVLVSKPPAKSVEKKVLAEIANCGKPVVVCFLGGSEGAVLEAGGHFARTTKEAALKAVILAGRNESEINKRALNLPLIAETRAEAGPAAALHPRPDVRRHAVRRDDAPGAGEVPQRVQQHREEGRSTGWPTWTRAWTTPSSTSATTTSRAAARTR